MLTGYVRVSTDDQNLAHQRGALVIEECERIFKDHGISGATRVCPGLARRCPGAAARSLNVVRSTLYRILAVVD